MGAKIGNSRDAAAWEMARRQHWVVSRTGLLALGFGSKAIAHRIAIGRLYPVHRGIYAVGHPDLTREGRWMAAVLACGPTAALSHLSAAAHWGIAAERRDGFDVSVRHRRASRRPGIRAHARRGLADDEVTMWRQIPVTSPVRTLIDIAVELPRRRLERAVNDADKLGRVGVEALREALEGHAGEPGVRLLRTLLDRHTFRLSDDELELAFRPLAAAAGLPVAETKAFVNGFEVDFFWPDLGLVVETDGLRYHRTPSVQSRDALRDQTHTAAGMTPLRFSHWQVKHEPARVRRVLAVTARRLRQRR